LVAGEIEDLTEDIGHSFGTIEALQHRLRTAQPDPFGEERGVRPLVVRRGEPIGQVAAERVEGERSLFERRCALEVSR
jgi:hypothetical protein